MQTSKNTLKSGGNCWFSAAEEAAFFSPSITNTIQGKVIMYFVPNGSVLLLKNFQKEKESFFHNSGMFCSVLNWDSQLHFHSLA